jgi:tetratricopeptide (TPR) repeat protein
MCGAFYDGLLAVSQINRITIVVIIAAAVVSYAGTFTVPFQFDDVSAVVENPTIRTLSLAALQPPPNQSPSAGRPLVNLAFAVNYAIGGLDVTGYHVVNLTLHIACALLVFVLIRDVLQRRGGPPGRLSDLDGVWLAGIIATAWAVHPLNTGAVTYISARSELLMAVCYLGAMYAAARAHTQSPRMWMATAVAACAAGMGCKESMVTAPVAIVLFDGAYVYDGVFDALRRRGGFYAWLCATWLVLVWLLWGAPHSASAGFDTGVSVTTYLMNQAVVIPEYLRLALWPDVLLFAYGEVRPLTLGDVGFAIVIVPALAAAAAWLWVRRPAAGFPAIWFFLTLAPTSSIVPIATEAGAARRMYLPLIGLVALAVAGGARAAVRLRRRRPVAWRVTGVATAIVLAALATETVRQNREYQSAETLWRGSLAEWPSALAHLNLANALKAKGARGEVVEHLRAAAELSPIERYTLGAELVEEGRAAEAIPELERAMAENPDNPRVIADASTALARALTDYGVALVQAGRPEEAVAPLERVADEHPSDASAQINVAAALAAAGQFAPAAAAACRALSAGAGDPRARQLLADIRAAAGEGKVRVADCREDR